MSAGHKAQHERVTRLPKRKRRKLPSYGTCKATGKRRFNSSSEAGQAALLAHIPLRPYPCKDCGGWHLSSKGAA